MKKVLVALLAVFVTLSFSGYSQGCTIQSPLTISTGWNPVTNSVVSPGNPDPRWKLIQAPTPPPGWTLNIGGPAHVIPQSSSWDAAGTTSNYINAFNTNSSVLNNWSTGVPYIFERQICICDPTGGNNPQATTFDFDVHADNWAQVDLVDNGGTVITTLLAQPFVYSTANFTNPATPCNTTVPLMPGTYFLNIHLRNQQVVMGVALDGTVSGPGVQDDLECDPSATIAGFKYNDLDQSGTITGSDPVVGGVTIELYDNMGVLIATTTTDQNGYYFFNVPPGTYTVKEVPGAGWTIVDPVSGEYTNITVTSGSIYDADFLNYKPGGQGGDCEAEISIKPIINGCEVTFNTTINASAGTNIVATNWTFGDGQTSTQLNPTHFYAQGNYTACVKILFFDGERCCEEEVCIEIEIEEPCENPCENPCDAEMESFELSVERCQLTASANVIPQSGWTIISATWSFGDGYSANGASVNHSYLTPGTYTVCYTVIMEGPDGECCTFQVCEEVNIEEPCDEPCEITGELQYSFDPETCTYTFNVANLTSNVPIAGFLWTFSDGTTDYGNPVTHQFPGPGTYEVCVQIFGIGPDGECCFEELCIEIEVPCKGNGGKEKSGAFGDAGSSVEGFEMTLFPNPSEGNFTVSLNLDNQSEVQLNIIDLSGKVVHGQFLGTVAEGTNTFEVNAQLPAGVYVLSATAEGYEHREQIMIK